MAELSHYEAVIDVIGSVEGIDALYIEKMEIWSGDTDASQTHSFTYFEKKSYFREAVIYVLAEFVR